MLKGEKVNLVLVERNELSVLKKWVNDLDFVGEFEPFYQETMVDLEKQYDNQTGQWFFIENKDGVKVGYIAHFKSKDCGNRIHALAGRTGQRLRERSSSNHG